MAPFRTVKPPTRKGQLRRPTMQTVTGMVSFRFAILVTVDRVGHLCNAPAVFRTKPSYPLPAQMKMMARMLGT